MSKDIAAGAVSKSDGSPFVGSEADPMAAASDYVLKVLTDGHNDGGSELVDGQKAVPEVLTDVPAVSPDEGQGLESQEPVKDGDEADPEAGENAELEREEWPESAKARQRKLIEEKREQRAKYKAAVEELTKLREELKKKADEPPPKQPEPEAIVPVDVDLHPVFQQVQSPADLDRIQLHAKTLAGHIDNFLDDAQSEDEANRFNDWAKKAGVWDEAEQRPDTKGVRRLRRQITELSDQVPVARERMGARAHFEAEAAQRYPWLNDPKSKESVMVSRLLQMVPEIGRYPSAKLWWARAVSGYMAEQAAQAQATPPKVEARGNPPKLPGAPAAKVTTPSGDKVEAVLRERALKSGNPEDAVAWVRTLLK